MCSPSRCNMCLRPPTIKLAPANLKVKAATKYAAQAASATDPRVRADHEHLAKTWRHLARCYQFVRSLELFLLGSGSARFEFSLSS
jgi:hypothetical protein